MTRHRWQPILWLTLVLLYFGSFPAAAGDLHFHSHEGDAQSENDFVEHRRHAARLAHWRDKHAADPHAWVRLKILGINDFHGQLSTGRQVANRPVGGAAVLASYLADAARQSRNGAIIVHAGDHVGASPPNSALLQDEPSISFLNMLANAHCRYNGRSDARCNLVGTLGNHEFDEGVQELRRLIDGGTHPQGPYLERPYRGARFPYICANVLDAHNGEPLLPPYVIKRVRGLPIGFVGAVLKETPSIVTPAGVAGLRFVDEADAINRYVTELKARGVAAIVVLIHQGARQTSYSGPTVPAPQVLQGAIADIVTRLDSEVDVVVTGHAHGFTNALVQNAGGKPILVTQAFSAGTAYADIDLAIDPASRDIVEKSARIVTTWGDSGPGLTPHAPVERLVAQADAVVAPLVNRIVAVAGSAITRRETSAGESALGNLIADAQRAAMDSDFAFMNPGGIRADIDVGEITWGELFAVQPFSNDLVRMELSGAQIIALLEQQWAGQPFARILKVSGLSYVWDNARPIGSRIVAAQDAAGRPIDPALRYRVTVNSFLASGGDNFSILTEGTQRVVGPVDLDALTAYLERLPQPVDYRVEGRVQRLN